MSDARLSSVLAAAADGILVLNEHAQILLFNPACESLFGYPAAEILGSSVDTILPPDHFGGQDGHLWDHGSDGLRKVIGIGHELTGRHRDGTIFPVDVSMVEAVTPEGPQFIGIVHDLRSQRDAEQRLLRFEEGPHRLAKLLPINEIGAVLAHELNQPLTALMLYLHAVEQVSLQQPNDRLPDAVVGILEKALHEAERARNIIQRMRRFVERRDPVRRLMDVSALVDEAVDLALLGTCPHSKITRDLAPNLPQIPVDPVQIQQIVVNLVANALDAVMHHVAPEVRISTRQEADAIILEVEDNGGGIPPHAMAHLFQPFSSSKGNGLGLGLVISRAIARNHGGDLTVDPGGGARGATFQLRLPLPVSVTSPSLIAC